MIDGTYDLLYLDFGSGFLPVGCLTSNGFSEDVETLDSTTKENGGWRTQVLTNQSYEITFSGIAINTIYSGDTTKYSYDVLKILKRGRVLLDWKIEDSVDGNIESGKAYITNLSSNSSIGQFVSFDGTLIGYGKPDTSNSNLLDEGIETDLETLL